MKRFLLTIAVLCYPAICMAGNLENGIDALKRGNNDLAFKLLEPLAYEGMPEAQFQMCGMYYQGQGVKKNEFEAAKWCYAAAQGHHPEAMFNLALLYQKGEGIAQNINEARYWYNQALERGHKASAFNLAMLDNPPPPKQKQPPAAQPPQPVPMMASAAPAPMMGAPMQLAQIEPAIGNPVIITPAPVVYATPSPEVACLISAQRGESHDICTEKQVKVVEKIVQVPVPAKDMASNGFQTDSADNFSITLHQAQKGDSKAQNDLGLMYLNGVGVAKNGKEAAKWLEKAANKGNSTSMFNLAGLYNNGTGVPKSPQMAYSWYNLAADRSSDQSQKTLAQNNVAELSRVLSNQQIAEALDKVTKLDEQIPQR